MRGIARPDRAFCVRTVVGSIGLGASSLKKMDEPETPAETAHTGDQPAPESGAASVVLATFENSYAAEHMVASLSHDFRHKARSGHAAAFVVTRNRDGSFKLVQSRVLTASGVVATAIRVTAAMLAGFIGSLSALRGAKGYTHAVRERQSHVGPEDEGLAELLDQLGPRAACVVLVCTDERTGQEVAARASERASDSAHYSRTEFLALLDQQGNNYDWIRSAVAEPAAKTSKNPPSPGGK